MYKDKDTAMASPIVCLTMNSNQKVLWERMDDGTYFRVKAQRRHGSTYETVSSRRLPSKTSKIDVTSRGIGYKLAPPAIANHIVKLCNHQRDREIYVALSFERDDHYLTEGWWTLTKGKCVEVSVNDRMKGNVSFANGKLPRVFYFAEMHSYIPKFWGGGPNDLSLCVEDEEAFDLTFPRKAASPKECKFGQRLVSFGLLSPRPGNKVTYSRSF